MVAKQDDEWFSISKAHLFFPGPVSLFTIRRWANTGQVSKKTGKLVHLRTRQFGGRRKTSLKCYEQFIKELNGET